MIEITDEEWDALASANFDTTTLLCAVDAIDKIRGSLGDAENGDPPQLRTDLVRLHQLAMAVFNQGVRGQVAEMFDTAADLDDQVYELMTTLKQAQNTLSQVTALYPESLSYGDLGDVD